MLSCLSLLHHTHVRVARHGDFHRTACGLSVTDGAGLFVDTAEAATCDRCRCSVEPRTRRAGAAPLPSDPKSVIRWLFDQVLNATDRDGLDAMLDDGRLTDFPYRLNRLRALFPSWHATIDDLIAEDGRVVARYHVDCSDVFGLADAAGGTHKANQIVIFRVVGRRIVHVQTIVDDFALWTGR